MIHITRLVCLCAFLASANARADFYMHFWEDQHRPGRDFLVAPEVTFLTTNQNYDSMGQLVDVPNLGGYNRIQTDILAGFAMNPRFTLWGRIGWASITVDSVGKSFGFTEQTIGGTMRIYEGFATQGQGVSFDLQFQTDVPAYSNATAEEQNQPFRGDGSIDFTGGGFLNVPFGRSRNAYWLLSGGGGFTYRTEGYSSAIPWSGTIRYLRYDKGFFMGASILGVLSMKTDQTVPSAPSSGGTGGSFMFGAVNPSNITGRVQLGYQLSTLVGLQLTGFQTIAGTDAPSVQAFSIALQYHLERTPPKGDPLRMTGPEYGRANQGLVHYTFEGRITKTNDRLNLVKIDKGSQDGVAVGQIFDIFSVRKDGSILEAVARAKCTSVQTDQAVLTISEYFKEVWIEDGFIVKKPL